MTIINRLSIIAMVLLVAALAAWLITVRPDRGTRRAVPLTAQGYPPPGGPPSPPPIPQPSPTPTASAGYFPPPTGIDYRLEAISASPYRDLLAALQAALDAGDPNAPAAWVTERFGNRLFDIAHLDSEGGVTMDRATTTAVLGGLLDQGATTRIQGYFAVDDGEVVCLDIVSALYPGEVPFPATPAPFGPRAPETLVGDAAAFHVCRDQVGDRLWQSWAYGGYHAIVATYDGLRGEGAAPYVVTRP